MAPGPIVAAKRPLVKPTKIRYFKGKAPDAALSDSDEESDDERVIAPEPVKTDKNIVAGGAGRIISDGGATMKVALRDVKVEGGRVVLPKAVTQGEWIAPSSGSFGGCKTNGPSQRRAVKRNLRTRKRRKNLSDRSLLLSRVFP